MSASLTTIADLKAYLGISTADDDDLLTSLIERVTAAIQRQLGRDIVQTAWYDERHSGDRGQWLRLRHFPVTEVSRLSIGVRDAIRLTNASSVSGAGRAYVSLSSATLSLTLIGGSYSGAQTLSLASYATISALVEAVNAVGNGWTASLETEACSAFPAVDLLDTCGRRSALDTPAALECPAAADHDFLVERPDAGLLYREAGFPSGVANIVVDYTAGYAAVPDDLQHACVVWAAAVYNRLREGADGLRSESLGELSQVFDGDAPAEALRILDARKEVLA